MDMLARKEAGEKIDSKDIKKHKNDVFRLYQLLTGAQTVDLPESVKHDMEKFLGLIGEERTMDLKSLGLKNTDLNTVIERIAAVYKITV